MIGRLLGAIFWLVLATAASAQMSAPPSTSSPLLNLSLQPGTWPLVGPATGFLTGTATGVSTTTACNLFEFPAAVTTDKIEAQVTTAEASGGAHFAIYNVGVDSSTKNSFPMGAPLAEDNASSPGVSIASTGVSGTANLTTPAASPTATNVSFAAGWYYGCVQTALGTGIFETQQVYGGGVAIAFMLLGSATDIQALPGNVSAKGGLYYSGGTYGTWPNTTSITGWAPVGHAYAPAFIYHVVSSP